MITFDAGARAEGQEFSPGLAHFCEHMVFKGTEKRSYLQIPKEIAYLGGNFNAFTSQEMVSFHISVPYEHTEKAVEILEDLVFHSVFPEEELVKEKEVVKEEEASGRDDVENFIWDGLCREFFGGRLAEPIIGTQETIDGFSLKELKKFHKKFYRKSNAIVVLASNHNQKVGKGILKKYFGKNNNTIKSDVKICSPSYGSEKEVNITWPKLEQVYLMLCWPGSPIGSSNEEVVEEMLLSILGQGVDSRLFTEVREKAGLCYDISAAAVGYRDYGATIINLSTRPENLQQVVDLVLKEIELLKTELVSEEELERARNKFRTETYTVQERSYSLAKTEMFRGFFNLTPYSELEEKMKEVTAESIRELANKIFDHSKKMVLVCREQEEV